MIRRACAADAESLTALQWSCFPPALHEPVGHLREAASAGTMLVLEEDAWLVGAVHAQLEDEGATWYLSLLMVAPDRRGEGLGSRLLAQAESQAPESVTAYRLRIGADRDDNRRLYERAGYAVVDQPAAPARVLVMSKSRSGR